MKKITTIMKNFLIIGLSSILIFSACAQKPKNSVPGNGTQTEKSAIEDETEKPENLETNSNSPKTIVKDVPLTTDYEGAKVPKSEILQGCFNGQDCIPSIDNPNFESAAIASSWLNDEDRVFAIEYKGEKRAYPQRILNWHEIVNDEIEGDLIMITFCPLCGSAVAFERSVDGIYTEFGVSGKLHNSDLIMYDRYEGNLWQQITGEAIVGPAARRDEVLTRIPITTTTWGEWKTAHPDTVALAIPEEFDRDYNQYPYGTYEENDQLVFGVENLDQSLQIKTVVYGIEVEDGTKAYPEELIKQEQKISDKIGNTEIEIHYYESGEITFTNVTTGEEVIPLRLFWFAWAAFNPDTELYE